MKKISLFLFVFTIAWTAKAQEFGAAIHLGYLTEINTVGFGADVLYDINDTWGVASNATIALSEVDDGNLNWFAVDLNAHYTFFDELYALAGGEYLNQTNVIESSVGGFTLGKEKVRNSDFGVNVGGGYRYNLVDNVSLFAEVKYVILETGYVHARAGLHFGF